EDSAWRKKCSAENQVYQSALIGMMHFSQLARVLHLIHTLLWSTRQTAWDRDPNQVVRASRRPASVPSPTHATYPSGRINTAVGADTAPSTGSSHTPEYRASISRTRS